MGLSATQYLKVLYPESTIIYAVPQWIVPLYRDSLTAADSIYPIQMKSFTDILKLMMDIKRFKIDHIHEMHQSGRGAKVLKGIALLLGIKYTAHNHHLKSDTGVVDQGKILPLIQRDLDGVFSFLGFGTRPQFLDFTPVMTPNKKINKTPMIIFGVVATRATKMWPLENYISLAKKISVKYPEYKIVIPLSKSIEDKKIQEDLIRLGLSENITIVNWNLQELPTSFQEAQFYVGNDTGLKHLAVGVGLKTFTFFGPEPANEWHPYNSVNHPYFYLDNLACRTRTHHYCGLSVCDLGVGNMDCLKAFLPEKVFELIEREIQS
jgi:heptosyltransferase-2